jgi:hypothetical protein
MTTRHWSSSAPFTWLRKKVFKIEKPYALGWGEWEEWDNNLKKTRPFANFVTEVLPDWLELIPKHTIDHLDNVRIYVRNRVNGTHLLNSTLERGKWHEFEERLLFASFDSYVDFIEIETANSHIAWGDKEETKKYNVPFRTRNRWFNWGGPFRCPQAAIDHLKWEMTLDQPDPTDPNHHPSPYQAKAAREKMELYTWWKVVRPSRGGSWDNTGFQAFWTSMDEKYGDGWMGLGGKKLMNAAEDRKYRKLSKASEDLEEQWHQEDEDMLIRLAKLRRSLWT